MIQPGVAPMAPWQTSSVVLACAVAVGCGAAPAPAPMPFRPAPEPATEPRPLVVAEADAGAAPVETIPVAASDQFDVGGLLGAHRERQTTTARPRAVAMPKLQKRWSAKVGKTTFRTTMALSGDAIVIGTHGASRDGKKEKDDGVYVLDAASGRERTLIVAPGTGDLDVGGVALDGTRVYFGTDNGLVVAAELAGRVVWKAAASGKVRAAPALADLDGDGQVDVVAGDESGALLALDGKTGHVLWTARTGANEYGARGFVAAPAIADLDGDQHDDVIAGARDGILAAYRGRDGKVLWQISGGSGIHASPSIADFDGDGRPEVLAAWSYGEVSILDATTGTRRWSATLERDDGGIEGLFGSPIPLAGAPGVIVAGTSWWGKDADGVVGAGMTERAWKSFEDRVTASAVVGDIDGDGTNEAVIGTEQGLLLALRADGGRAELAKLGGGIEAPALFADVDADGTSELLVASNDGQLTCFLTHTRGKPPLPRFRGESAHNRGDLGNVGLGWRSAGGHRGAQTGAHSGVRIDYQTCCTALQQTALRAPSPEDAALLQAASLCLAEAAQGKERAEALQDVEALLRGKSALPADCR